MALLLAHKIRIERAGAALLSSVAAFGVATMVFGASTSFWLSLGMLVLVGAFDNVSVVLASVADSERDTRCDPGAGNGRQQYLHQLFESARRGRVGLGNGVAGYSAECSGWRLCHGGDCHRFCFRF